VRTVESEHPLDVLVADAWPSSREGLLSAVRRAGHVVDGVADGEGASRTVKARAPGVVLVDAALAEADNWGLIARLREASPTAVAIALGPDDDELEVQALTRGFDDYLVKPVRPAALAAHISAAMRMLRRVAEPRRDEVYDDGLVRLHAALRRVEVAGREVALTPLEFRLMSVLIRNRDRVVGRDELQEATWHGSAPPGGDHVKLYVHYLRRKLAEHTPVELIQTVRGFGYRWLGREAAEANGDRSSARLQVSADTG
jgi:DNA-binding response OmpR family regulator